MFHKFKFPYYNNYKFLNFKLSFQYSLIQALEKGQTLQTIKPKESELPTFSQFLSFIISTPNSFIDNHWRPYHKTCQPCFLKYNAIVKLETADVDSDYVMMKSGLGNLTSYKRANVSKGGMSSRNDIREKYFSKVKCSLLKKVYEYYQLDFKLFDYEPDEFYKICDQKNEIW